MAEAKEIYMRALRGKGKAWGAEHLGCGAHIDAGHGQQPGEFPHIEAEVTFPLG